MTLEWWMIPFFVLVVGVLLWQGKHDFGGSK